MAEPNHAPRRGERGTTLVEAMAATVVLLIVATGLLGMYTQQLRMTGDARRVTEASALAQDLVENIAQWSYNDARLANTNTANDGDIGDTAYRFEAASPPADHGEADLTAGGAVWNGLPARAGFERYWNVSDKDYTNPGLLLDSDGNGVADGLRIAVIVRWPQGTGWRRLVLMTMKPNPAEVQ